VYTKRAPVIKAETLVDNEVDIDTTGDADIVEAPLESLTDAPVVSVEEVTSEETK
jgi:hypothetical protein